MAGNGDSLCVTGMGTGTGGHPAGPPLCALPSQCGCPPIAGPKGSTVPRRFPDLGCVDAWVHIGADPME